jgi:hypothetical protein
LIFQLGVIPTGGRLSHQATCPFEEDFGCMALWDLVPEVIGSLQLMDSATWVEINLAQGLHDWGKRPCPFELYHFFCLTNEEKYGKPQSW